MATLEQWQQRLAEAEDARHQLALGETVVEVWRDGRRVTYSQAKIADLDAYVLICQREIEKAQALLDNRPARRAIGTYFG